jgi:hypothetical protein
VIDVRGWLAEHGLEQYAEAFTENAIDGESLRTLSDDDLKELGVKALGHRKKLLAAMPCSAKSRRPRDRLRTTEHELSSRRRSRSGGS